MSLCMLMFFYCALALSATISFWTNRSGAFWPNSLTSETDRDGRQDQPEKNCKKCEQSRSLSLIVPGDKGISL